MEFEQAIESVIDRVERLGSSVDNEEAAKTAFVLPFINDVLQYDIFNPNEVFPEYTCDVGVKKGEKVDYALMCDGQVRVLIECKDINEPLTLENASQLYRYFTVSRARIGILTNGRVWQFYTDLDAANIMDDKPFMVLDMLNPDENLYPQIKKLTKESFDIDTIVNSAEQLKYMSAIRRELTSEFKNPSEEFVRFIGKRIYDKPMTQVRIDKFTPLVQKCMKQFINDQVNERLMNAMGVTEEQQIEHIEESIESDICEIVTTDEELDGFAIVRAICCSLVDANRIFMRDAKSYCAILLDDNNRKGIVRLYFNNPANLRLCTLNNNVEEMHQLEQVSDIYKFSELIKERVNELVN